MPELGAHDWFRPRLSALLHEARAAGFGRDVFTAVVTDLVNGADFAPETAAPQDNWAQDIGEPAGLSLEMPGHAGVPPDDSVDARDFPEANPHLPLHNRL